MKIRETTTNAAEGGGVPGSLTRKNQEPALVMSLSCRCPFPVIRVLSFIPAEPNGIDLERSVVIVVVSIQSFL